MPALMAHSHAGRRDLPGLEGALTRYLISFDDGAMDHISEEELPAVGDAAQLVVREAQDAGAWVFGGGLASQLAVVVATDGTHADGPHPEPKAVIGGFSIIDVPSEGERHPGPGPHDQPTPLSLQPR
jgi:hypothetical protein